MAHWAPHCAKVKTAISVVQGAPVTLGSLPLPHGVPNGFFVTVANSVKRIPERTERNNQVLLSQLLLNI